MKKLSIILIFLFAFSTICDAQLISSRQFTRYKRVRPHAIWVDLGLSGSNSNFSGDLNGQYKSPSLAVNLRWTKRYSDYFAMDYINLGAQLLYPEAEKNVFHINENEVELYWSSYDEPQSIISFKLGPRLFFPITERNSLFASYNAGAAMVLNCCFRDVTGDEPYINFQQELNLGFDFHKRVVLSVFCSNTPNHKFDIEHRYYVPGVIYKDLGEYITNSYSLSLSHTIYGLKFGFSF